MIAGGGAGRGLTHGEDRRGSSATACSRRQQPGRALLGHRRPSRRHRGRVHRLSRRADTNAFDFGLINDGLADRPPDRRAPFNVTTSPRRLSDQHYVVEARYPYQVWELDVALPCRRWPGHVVSPRSTETSQRASRSRSSASRSSARGGGARVHLPKPNGRATGEAQAAPAPSRGRCGGGRHRAPPHRRDSRGRHWRAHCWGRRSSCLPRRRRRLSRPGTRPLRSVRPPCRARCRERLQRKVGVPA